MWTATGTGSGQAKAKDAQAITATGSAVSTDLLYPGKTDGDAGISITNPNPYPVRITSIARSGAITATPLSGRTCATTGVTFTDQTGNYNDDAGSVEIVIFGEGGKQDFDGLGQRIHPAESRIKMLAEETPAIFRAFDVLGIEDEVLEGEPLSERRARLGVQEVGDVGRCPAAHRRVSSTTGMTRVVFSS